MHVSSPYIGQILMSRVYIQVYAYCKEKKRKSHALIKCLLAKQYCSFVLTDCWFIAHDPCCPCEFGV